jgi:hypothetical protein
MPVGASHGGMGTKFKFGLSSGLPAKDESSELGDGFLLLGRRCQGN